MTQHNGRLLLAFGAICLVFSGAVAFSLSRARGDQLATRQVGNAFYTRLAARDYEGARTLLTRERQSELSAATLGRTMKEFEAKHGRLTRWLLVQTPTIYGNRVSIFPRYVEESRLLQGTQGAPGAALLHLQLEDGAWKIGRVSIVP